MYFLICKGLCAVKFSGNFIYYSSLGETLLVGLAALSPRIARLTPCLREPLLLACTAGLPMRPKSHLFPVQVKVFLSSFLVPSVEEFSKWRDNQHA